MTQQAIQMTPTRTGTPAEPSPSVRDLIRARIELAEVADPREAVAGLVDELGDEELRQIAADAIGSLAVDVARGIRNSVIAGNGSAKWAHAARANRDHPGVLGVIVYVGDGQHKFLGDCDATDLAYVEREERKQGETMLARAGHYRRIRAKLRKGQVVADLGLAKVEAIFNA